MGIIFLSNFKGESKMDNKENKDNKYDNENEEPTLSAAMNTHDELEEKATDEEKAKGDSTKVTKLFLDRTPED
jgi:hypothetical protein